MQLLTVELLFRADVQWHKTVRGEGMSVVKAVCVK